MFAFRFIGVEVISRAGNDSISHTEHWYGKEKAMRLKTTELMAWIAIVVPLIQLAGLIA